MRLSRRTVKKKGKAKAGGSSTERSTPAYTLPVSKGSHVKLGTFDTAELAASAYDRCAGWSCSYARAQRGHHGTVADRALIASLPRFASKGTRSAARAPRVHQLRPHQLRG